MSLLLSNLTRARRGQTWLVGSSLRLSKGYATVPQNLDEVDRFSRRKTYRTGNAAFFMGQRKHAFSTTTPPEAVQVVKLHNIKELTDFLVGNYISESDSTSTGAKYLLKVLEHMRENPSTRMLSLSRLALKAPSSLKWFCSWLWPLLNGIKPPDEAFPMSVEMASFCSEADKAAMQAELWRCVNLVQEDLKEIYKDSSAPLNSWAYKGEENKAANAPTLESFHEFIPSLFGKVPLPVLRKICEHLESLNRGELDMIMYLKHMKKTTSFHCTDLAPVLVQTGLSNEFLQERYRKSCAKSRKSTIKHLEGGLEALFSQLKAERLEQEQSQHKDLRTLYLEKQALQNEKKNNKRDGRKFGINHALYVTLQVERIPHIDDYGGDDLRWQHVTRRADSNMGVGIAQEGSSSSDGDGLYDVNEVKPPIIGNLSDVQALNVPLALSEDQVHFKGEDVEFRAASVSSERKIFIENIPDSVDERDIALALRNCGDVKRVWLHRSDQFAEHTGANFGNIGSRQNYFKNEFKNETVAESYYSKVKQMAAAKGPIREEKVFYHPLDPKDVETYAKDDSTIVVEEMSAAEAQVLLEAEAAKGNGNDDWLLIDDDTDEAAGFVKLKMDRKGKGKGKAADLAHGHGAGGAGTGTWTGIGQRAEEISIDLSAFGEDDNDRNDLSLMGDSEKTSLKYVVSRMLKEEASAASKKQKKKSAALKKRVARTKRNFNYAYVTMNDNEAYDRATRDEMRIFGMFLDGHSCRIQESARLRTLILGVAGPLTCETIRSHLVAILGPWFSFELPRTKANHLAFRNSYSKQLQWDDVAFKKPVFIHLEFNTHEDAWKGFEALDQASQEGSPLSVSWVKSQLYWKVARKAKEMAFDSKSKQVGLEIEQVLQDQENAKKALNDA